MALQFLSLFGHTHAGAGAQHASAHIASFIDDRHAVSDHVTLPAPEDEALCTVCLVGHLAGVAMTPSAPVLFVPVAHAPRAPPVIAIVRAAQFESPFWSQGPPAV